MKTVTSLQVIADLKRPCLILVNKGFLMNQWKERIKEFYDIKDEEIGIVQQDTCQYKGRKVVIAMAQSLLSRVYSDDFYNYFGIICLDECYSPDTEILTDSGWIRFDKLEKGVKVAQYSLEGVEFVDPLRYVKKDYEGDLINIKGRQVDLMVTPNHDQSIVKKYKDGSVHLIKEKAKDVLFYPTKMIPMSGNKNSGRSHLDMTERLQIAIQADGYIVPLSHSNGRYSGTREVQFSFKKEKKINRLRYILSECGFGWSEKLVSRGRTRFIAKIPTEVVLTKNLGDWVNLQDISSKWGDQFMEELMNWDGSVDPKYPDRLYYSSVVPENVDTIQAIAAISGYTCTRSVQVDDRKDAFNDVHRIYMWKREFKTTQAMKKEHVPYKGKVYCVEVPTGHIIVRRKGNVTVSGNCHNFSAPSFRQTITMFPARYRIGLSATPKRKDGLEILFESHVGPIGARGEKRKVKPEIKQVPAKIKVASEKPFHDWKGKVNLTKAVGFIVESETYNRQIAQLAIQAAEARRKIIVFSDRIKHLELIEDMLKAEMGKKGLRIPMGYYIGGMKEEELTISATKTIILSTYAMGKEGLDVPELDTCFLTTPKSDIEQTVGRITRDHPDKKNPMVIDFVQPVSVCMGMAKKRRIQYKKLGWME